MYLFFNREWVCEPAWRSISEWEAASSFQKEKNDRIGFGGCAPLRDLQNFTGAHQHSSDSATKILNLTEYLGEINTLVCLCVKSCSALTGVEWLREQDSKQVPPNRPLRSENYRREIGRAHV